MAIPSSQSMSSQSDELYRLRMSPDLYKAIIEGNRDVLIPRLGLQPDEPTDVQITIEATHSGDTKKLIRTVQAELRSVARCGDTVLHLLVNRRHNELALMVFKRDTSLLKLKNKMSETPLHYAARAGNSEVIKELTRIDADIVKDVLEEINENEDTAMHIATKQGHIDCVLEFFKLNKEILYTVNKQQLSPIHIYIAITKGYTDMVIHFMKNYPEHAELLDDRERNIFHIAAEENHKIFFLKIFFSRSLAIKEMAGRMNNAVDYDGNTPMHIAAMKGHTSIVRAIWESNRPVHPIIGIVAETIQNNEWLTVPFRPRTRIGIVAETIQNNEGLTPFEVSLNQLREHSEQFDGAEISMYLRIQGHKFTRVWFNGVAVPLIVADKWEKIQVIGLGSVLITTVTFAAAFTIPGGYDQNHGTPILGRKYIFRAFILANSLAFIQGFLSLFSLLWNATEGPTRYSLAFAIHAFVLAASSMVVAFGFGIYVTLAPISLPLAIIILVTTLLLASAALLYFVAIRQKWMRVYVLCDIMSKFGIWIMVWNSVSMAIILGLALL